MTEIIIFERSTTIPGLIASVLIICLAWWFIMPQLMKVSKPNEWYKFKKIHEQNNDSI